jgi:ribonuclease P protein component
LQRSLRLTHSTAFEKVRSDGQVVKQPALLLSWLASDHPHNRYGIIISKRLGKAVLRNRLRRQIRACLQGLHPLLIPGHDVVIIARPPLIQLDFRSMCQVLDKLAHKAGLHCL